MTDEDGATIRRRIGPLGVAIALALVPAIALGATVAVKQMTARHRSADTVRTLPPAPTQLARAQPISHPALHSTVASGVDVVYWANWDGVHGAPYPLHAVDWSGHDRGGIDLPATTEAARPDQQPVAIGSPDGGALLVDTDVYAANGTWLGRMPSNGELLWADDGRVLCHLRSTIAGPTGIEVDLLGLDGNVRSEATVRNLDATPGSRATLLSCSATAMRADVLVSDRQPDSPTRVLQFDLRGGGLGMSRSLCTGSCVESPVASTDGALLAYDDATERAQLVTIADGATHSLGIQGTPVVFTGDGNRLLIALQPPPSSSTLHTSVPGLRLVEWRTGRVAWSRPDSNTLQQWGFALPGPNALAVAACENGAGSFGSGGCSLDIVTPAGVAETGQGLDTAFGWGPF